jgi:hypothetical protein
MIAINAHIVHILFRGEVVDNYGRMERRKRTGRPANTAIVRIVFMQLCLAHRMPAYRNLRS